ncbi:nickel-dependent hydrogenase large subunit [Sulfurovum sp. NBC37-1]|uniref:nickel-dependent hydrogenase large subunit n=1 Tax=Sulfurovum sp. (strain NBC37-1) TaxID=387093 RepID=UPI0001587D21|nr:nickel-dependent hydrogenase large subunit [Sulfurovum sp. NBC37-1]BAF72614.1 Ni-Fe hydrogenase, large subunit HupV [Sulfurovum sp. NBC37-1]
MKRTVIRKLIEKIEGEAELDYTFANGSIEDVRINFGFYRGIEEILVGKDPRDALVITPRVCGICNHAHLIAAVRALENGYASAGWEVVLSPKAKAIREFTLSCELLQNHIKWMYMTIFPNLERYLKIESSENYAVKASYFSTTITKALAIFAGQWPHSSYAVPGGVTCDPTQLDIIQAQSLLEECVRFFEQMLTGCTLEAYLSIESVSSLHHIEGDFGKLLHLLGSNGMAKKGQSYDRFIVFADSPLSPAGKSIATSVSKVDTKYVVESEQKGSMAKAVSYKNRMYEVGPLARGMVSKEPIVKNLHKRYKDSMMTRVFARIHEVAQLLEKNREMLKSIRVDEPSCTLSDTLKLYEFEGTGTVEAARGSLIHRTTVSNGKIANYEIITPTQWNLSHGDEKEKGIAVKAMVGSQSMEEADFIFRTFDVCSVCTAQ